MVVNSDVQALTLAGAITTFNDAYHAVKSNAIWPQLATQIDTTLPSQVYPFLGNSGLMLEVKDERQEQELRSYSYTINDKEWAADLVILRKTMEDEQYGLIEKGIQDLARVPDRHLHQLIVEQLALGASQLCYDGQYFIDTDHSDGASGTQSNKGTAALSNASLGAAEVAMLGFLDDAGVPMEITPDTLVVGPKNKQIAWELTMSGVAVLPVGTGTAGSGSTAPTSYANYWQGSYKVIVSPYLKGAYDDYWFLMDTSRAIKPMILQMRSDVPITFETDLLSPEALRRGRFHFGPRGRYNAGYGLWQTVYGGIL